MLTGVLDSNGIIGLAKGGVFALLTSLYATLYVPPAVVQEVMVQGQGRPGAAELAQALGAWITQAAPDPVIVQQFPTTLSLADREVLALAREHAVHYLVSGDEGLRQQAIPYGLSCLRASEVVVLLKAQGLIPAVKPVLDQMRQGTFGISSAVYQQALQAAGE